MKILSLDTSAKTATAAVVEGDQILAESSVNAGLTHSQTVMPMLSGMLSAAKLTLNDVDLIAVSHGPGSFTGIRIGIGAVKGLAQGLQKPCFGVSTLEGLIISRGWMGMSVRPWTPGAGRSMLRSFWAGTGKFPGNGKMRPFR